MSNWNDRVRSAMQSEIDRIYELFRSDEQKTPNMQPFLDCCEKVQSKLNTLSNQLANVNVAGWLIEPDDRDDPIKNHPLDDDPIGDPELNPLGDAILKVLNDKWPNNPRNRIIAWWLSTQPAVWRDRMIRALGSGFSKAIDALIASVQGLALATAVGGIMTEMLLLKNELQSNQQKIWDKVHEFQSAFEDCCESMQSSMRELLNREDPGQGGTINNNYLLWIASQNQTILGDLAEIRGLL